MNYEALEKHYPLFNEILRILPGAAIAGGFIRDTLLDKPVRDMDILWDGDFDSLLITRQAEELSKLLNTTIETLPAFERTAEYIGEEAEGDRQSFPQKIFKGDNVDIIIVPDVHAHILDFPDNISKCWYGHSPTAEHPRMGLNMASDFICGHANKEILYRISAPEGRLQKLKDKYPDYSVAYKLRRVCGPIEDVA